MRGIISKLGRRWQGALAVLILLMLTEAMFLRPSMLGGKVLLGHDFFRLHSRRMAFAQGALSGPRHALPGWYPNEFMGTPFSANMQSFPWIPTRLLIFPLDPFVAFEAGVALAAALAALFTYLFCRRAGLSKIGAMAAGWTFACAGYFMARVLAGHLPLLEAYPALPLLLWLADRALSPDRADRQVRDLIVLAVTSACVALAGHPQVPAYAIGAALLYIVVRGRGWQRLRTAGAMLLGTGMTLAAWWPMLLLIQRSTRLLHLAPAANDIVMPWRRLLAIVVPGIHGWVDSIPQLAEKHPFEGFPNDAYFWDTTVYIGLLPLAVVLVLFVASVVKTRMPAWPFSFLWLIGAGSLILALPATNFLRRMMPGTILRSPSRLLYLSTFAACVLLGFGVTAFLKSKWFTPRVRQAIVLCCLILHFVDLGAFGRVFVRTVGRPPTGAGPYQQTLAREVDGGRIASDFDFMIRYVDRFDDAGVFDSLLLANPYRTILRLRGEEPDLNTQQMDASDFTVPALRATGVRYVVTGEDRKDLTLVDGSDEDANLYRVPNPAPRTSFFADTMVDFLPSEKIVDAFASRMDEGILFLPEEARKQALPLSAHWVAPQVNYSRPSSDEIRLDTTTDQGGFAYVVETSDPGWSAEVDGKRAPIVTANGFAMAVHVAPGKHSIRMRYRTPGRKLGWVLSLLSCCALLGLLWTARYGGARCARS